jgi:hypothetical protein
LVALTLPEDVLAWLRTVDPDPARAIVGLFDRAHDGASLSEAPTPVGEIALLTGRRGLIVVDRRAVSGLPGVELLPLDASRAFLALDPGADLADLELAVMDRLDESLRGEERETLAALRSRLREWRRDPTWRFEPRGIVVAERRAGARRP